MRALFLEHGLDLAALAAVNPWGGPLGLPVLQKFILLSDRIKPTSLERGGLRVADGVLHGVLAIGVTNLRGIVHHTVVG